jgi:hypothetical protein
MPEQPPSPTAPAALAWSPEFFAATSAWLDSLQLELLRARDALRPAPTLTLVQDSDDNA